ncbi:MAG: putative dinitrogenase reductase activating glycohydrolase [Firmicutes bacterium]|nr:putative dinitrogenase reductase activating glycohydrolase [Bacillota bacterium]
MDWQQPFLVAVKQSQQAWDDQPDWRGALLLYDGLTAGQADALDRTVIAMIDEDYRNPFSGKAERPFDDVMVGLPAGLTPDDLLCIEAAVLVAAERRIGPALFAFNRLMRAPRWHALYPRLLWLGEAGFDAQRKLADTPAGRGLGGLLGMAAGDALGVTVEFQSRATIRHSYPDGHRDIKGGGPFGFAPGEWSDDTAMALAVARGIAEQPRDPVPAVGRHFMAWYGGHPPDVGSTCRLALEAFGRTGSWAEASDAVRQQLGNRAGGNGALMRTLPTALAYGNDTAPALAIARMTHPHPESDAAVAVYHLAVQRALEGGATREQVVAAGLRAAGPLTARLAGLQTRTEAEIRSGGYVVETLEAALWCFLTTDSLEACIIKAVNLGDDTDTTGAVAGGLAGAYYGPQAVPRRWSTAIPERLQLEEAAERLFTVQR